MSTKLRRLRRLKGSPSRCRTTAGEVAVAKWPKSTIVRARVGRACSNLGSSCNQMQAQLEEVHGGGRVTTLSNSGGPIGRLAGEESLRPPKEKPWRASLTEDFKSMQMHGEVTLEEWRLPGWSAGDGKRRRRWAVQIGQVKKTRN